MQLKILFVYLLFTCLQKSLSIGEFGLKISPEVWMSKKGSIHEITIPTKVTNNSPFRQNFHLKMLLRSNGCSCESLFCGCCLDFNISQFNFQRTGCMNLTMDPRQFSVTFNMLWDNAVIFQNELSGKNPPPICVPLPVPYIPTLDACVRVFDLSVLTEESRVHACLDLDARIQRAPIVVLHFNCMQIGSDASVDFVRPTVPYI